MRVQKRRKNRLPLVIIILIVMLLAIFIINRDNYKEPIYPEDINGVKVYTDLLPVNSAGRPGDKREIKYIVIHETDNEDPTANAAAHNNYLHDIAQTQKLSWHYTVDENEIYHHIPDDEIAFNAGDRHTKDGGNINGIGIEMCVNEGSDYEKTLDNTARLAAYLIKAYDLSIDDVKKHQDFSGKNCPSKLIESGRWDEFLGMIDTYLKNEN